MESMGHGEGRTRGRESRETVAQGPDLILLNLKHSSEQHGAKNLARCCCYYKESLESSWEICMKKNLCINFKFF